MKVGDLVRLKRYVNTDVYGVVVEVLSTLPIFVMVQNSKGQQRMERRSWLEVINGK